jgi:hypothetical protein
MSPMVEGALLAWMGASILAFVVNKVALFFWLAKRGVDLKLSWIGMPGYLLGEYGAACERFELDPSRWKRVTWILTANAVMALLVFVFAVALPASEGPRHTIRPSISNQ